MTVGVAGLVLGGGFGSYSKGDGLAAASLIEAEIVTADGDVKIANACSNPDLFWALKGGGGGFGVVTRVTLNTYPLPNSSAACLRLIKASSDDAYRRLIAKTVDFDAQALFNPHWGEQILVGRGYVAISMAFQGLNGNRRGRSGNPSSTASPPRRRTSLSCRRRESSPDRRDSVGTASALKPIPGVVIADDRPTRRQTTFFGPATSKRPAPSGTPTDPPGSPPRCSIPTGAQSLADALFAAAKPFGVALHFNKGLAGAPADAIAAAKDTATNPAVVDAFALVLSGAFAQPAYPGVPGHEPDAGAARSQFDAVNQSMDEIRKLLPRVTSYVWETDSFQPNWQDAFWGENYSRLRTIKDKYDPAGLSSSTTASAAKTGARTGLQG